MSDIIIAARGGPNTKTRFAPRLDARARESLTAAMLEAMLFALRDVAARVWVVTPTADLAMLARDHGACAIVQDERSGLNDAFELALAKIATAHLVTLLPGDLPLLDPIELDSLFDAVRTHDVAVAPALRDGGTGALALRGGASFRPCFGPESCSAHIAAARALGLRTTIVHAPTLGADIDRPEDLHELLPSIAASRLPLLLKHRFAEIDRAATHREVA